MLFLRSTIFSIVSYKISSSSFFFFRLQDRIPYMNVKFVLRGSLSHKFVRMLVIIFDLVQDVDTSFQPFST